MTELLVLNDGKQELQAVSLDGTQVHTLLTGLDERPDGIVVDQSRRYVYWANMAPPIPVPAPVHKWPTPATGHKNVPISTAPTEGHHREPRGVHHRQTAHRRFRRGRAVLVRSGGHGCAVLQPRR